MAFSVLSIWPSMIPIPSAPVVCLCRALRFRPPCAAQQSARRIRTAERRIVTPLCQARGLQRGAPIRALRLEDAIAREAITIVAIHKFHGRPLTIETRVLQLAACEAFAKDASQSGLPKIFAIEFQPGEFIHRSLPAQVDLRFDSPGRGSRFLPPASDSHVHICKLKISHVSRNECLPRSISNVSAPTRWSKVVG